MEDSATRRRSSASIEAARDAMCIRIRELGTSILAITQAAVEKVEALDAAYAAAAQRALDGQKRRAHPQQHHDGEEEKAARLSPRPNVNAKTLRTVKSATSVGGRGSSRPATQSRPVLGGRTSPGVVSAAAAPTHARAADGNNTAASGAKSHSAGKKKRKTGRSTSPTAAPSRTLQSAAKNEKEDSQSMAPQSVFNTRAPSATSAMAGTSAVEPRSNNEGSPAFIMEGQATNSAPHEAHNDVHASQRAAMAVRQSAADSFQRLLDQHRHPSNTPRSSSSSSGNNGGLLHPAPLYDLSNAAIAAAVAEMNDVNASASSIFQESASAAENSANEVSQPSLNAMGAAKGPQSTGSVVYCADLPANVDAELAALLAHEDTDVAPLPERETLAETPPQQRPVMVPTNYYRVVYIHQSTRQRKQSGSAGGSGYNSSRSGVLRRRPTPHSVSLQGRTSPASMGDREEDEAGDREPRMINSYVSAVYAVEEGRRRAAAAAAASAVDVPHVSAAGTAALDSVVLEPPVRVELRVPTAAMAGSRASSPTENPFAFAAHRAAALSATNNESVDDVHGAPTPEDGQGERHSDGDADVAAQIASMEGWQRDRRTSVEHQIRQRRHSAFVSPGWDGEYYYYSSPPRAPGPRSPAGGAAPAAAPGEAVGTAGAGFPPGLHGTHTAAGEDAGTEASGGRAMHSIASGIAGHPDPVHPEERERSASPPAQPQLRLYRDPITSSPQPCPNRRTASPQHSPGRPTASPSCAGAATTYDVLLQTRPSVSASSTPRTGRGRSASAAAGVSATPASGQQQEETAEVASRPAEAQPDAQPTGQRAVSPVAAALPHRLSGAAAPHASKRRRYPRLEVVVASDYNSLEWAFAGAARRASEQTADGEAAGEAQESPSQRERELATDAEAESHGASLPPTPEWAVHQRREMAEEEHRRWNARTRQPHGADIHSTIVLQLTV